MVIAYNGHNHYYGVVQSDTASGNADGGMDECGMDMLTHLHSTHVDTAAVTAEELDIDL